MVFNEEHIIKENVNEINLESLFSYEINEITIKVLYILFVHSFMDITFIITFNIYMYVYI